MKHSRNGYDTDGNELSSRGESATERALAFNAKNVHGH